MLFEIWIYKCVLGICCMMLCLGFGVIGDFVNLYEKKDKMCLFKCIISLIEIYKRYYNFLCNIDVIIFI